jgi:hypothetical protein
LKRPAQALRQSGAASEAAPVAVGWSVVADTLLFAALGLWLAWPSLRWPMVYDDLHLIRSFTSAEMRSAWNGSWDPDGIETPGFRPLSLLFNHLRHALLGEDVVAHRVFLIGLLSLSLALLVRLAQRLGLPRAWALLAAGIVLTSRYTVYHYIWLTSGNRLVQLLLALVVTLLLRRAIERGERAALVASIGGVLLLLLLREDSIALAAVSLLLAAPASASAALGRSRPRAAFAAALVVLAALLFGYRGVVVPAATKPGLNLRDWIDGLIGAANPMGQAGFDAASTFLIGSWNIGAVALLALLAARPKQVSAARAGLWLGAAGLAATPCLTLRRQDLYFFPMIFLVFAVASAAAGLARALPAARLFVVVFGLAWAGGAYTSRVFAENYHPMSSTALWLNGRFVYGPYADRATIPESRRSAVRRRLAALGIHRWGSLRLRLRELVHEALAAKRRRPVEDGAVFVPLLREGDEG